MCAGALTFLSNITAGSHAQVQSVVESGLVHLIVQHLDKGEFPTQKEAVWAVRNMTLCGNKDQVEYLTNCGVIPPFCNLLNCQDSQVLQLVLDGIRNILKKSSQGEVGRISNMVKECGGLDKIKTLQNHEDIKIYKIAYDILENFFDEIEEDPNLLPETAGEN